MQKVSEVWKKDRVVHENVHRVGSNSDVGVGVGVGDGSVESWVKMNPGENRRRMQKSTWKNIFSVSLESWSNKIKNWRHKENKFGELNIYFYLL